MGMDNAICLDIGGTFIKYALVDMYGNIHDLNRERTSKGGQESVLHQLFSIIDRLLACSDGRNIIGIGISSAGQVSYEKGTVLSATDNIPGWAGTKVKEIFENRYRIKCHVDNDVKCAALGELYFGNGSNFPNFLCLAIGTGIGGAVVSEGRLLRGADGIAGEVGHMVIKAGGRECNCGNRGCFEQYASVTGLKRTVSEELGRDYLPEDTGVEWLFDRYPQDRNLQVVIDQFVEYIADGITSLVNVLNPNAIVIGGAVSENGFLMDKVIKNVNSKVMPVYSKNLKVLPALAGNSASLLGISTYIFKSNPKEVEN